MPTVKIGELLGASDELRAVAARTKRLRQLQKLYAACAPDGLDTSSSVKNARDGVLYVGATNASTAAKLRHLAPRILSEIQRTEPDFRELRVSVQVTGRAAARRKAMDKTPVPARALRDLEALSKRIGDGDLSAALTRLVRHQRKSSR